MRRRWHAELAADVARDESGLIEPTLALTRGVQRHRYQQLGQRRRIEAPPGRPLRPTLHDEPRENSGDGGIAAVLQCVHELIDWEEVVERRMHLREIAGLDDRGGTSREWQPALAGDTEIEVGWLARCRAEAARGRKHRATRKPEQPLEVDN